MRPILFFAAGAVVTAVALLGTFLSHADSRTKTLFADYTPGPEIPAPQNDQAALELLALENHLLHPISVVPSNPDLVMTYKRQLKTIDYVRERRLIAVPQLICYLDYATQFMVPIDAAHGQQFDLLSKLFPAYGALLDISGEVPQLKAYCLDPSRPFPSRIEALMVLHAVDDDADAHATAVQMHDQEKDPRHRQQMEEMILPSNEWFHFWFEGV
jgi:hypothetical protein